jgi:hypothetical protein
MRIRGTASQIYDKYCALAHDANASGDRIAAENYLQHAEHYFRIHNANGGTPARGQQQKGQPQSKQDQASQDIPGTGPQPDVEPASEGKSKSKEKPEAVVETSSEGDEEVEKTAPAAD